jgi:hypothetical protein
MKSLRFFILSISCAMLLAGCGTTDTRYVSSVPLTGRQKKEVFRTVDATARLFGMSVAHDYPGSSYREYSRHSLSLSVFYGWTNDGLTHVFLSVSGKSKTRGSERVEDKLTPALRLIDPHFKIETVYVPNPMM